LPTLTPFTKDFPGWHIDEIFTFISNNKPIDVVNMIRYLVWDKAERKRMEEEYEVLKEQLIEKEKEEAAPKVKTRHWKKNEDNLKSDKEKNELSLRMLKKGKNRSFMVKIQQILGLEQIDLVKTQQLLIQGEFDAKKLVRQISAEPEYYKEILAGKH